MDDELWNWWIHNENERMLRQYFMNMFRQTSLSPTVVIQTLWKSKRTWIEQKWVRITWMMGLMTMQRRKEIMVTVFPNAQIQKWKYCKTIEWFAYAGCVLLHSYSKDEDCYWTTKSKLPLVCNGCFETSFGNMYGFPVVEYVFHRFVSELQHLIPLPCVLTNMIVAYLALDAFPTSYPFEWMVNHFLDALDFY